MDAWEEAALEPEEIVGAGDKVLARVRYRGRAKNEGIQVEAQVFHVFTFRSGKATAIEVYGDESQAREAAGLQG